jgi:hypothetical protein
VKPLPSQASDVANQPVGVTEEQTQDGGPSSKLDPEHPVTPAKETIILPSQATRPAEPSARLPEASANDESPGFSAGNNALSVLSEALSSVKAVDPVLHNTPTDFAQSSHDGTPTKDPSLATAIPGLLTIALADGGSATVRLAESSLIVAQNGLSAAAAAGSKVTIGTHVFSAAPQGTAVVVDNIATHAVPSPTNPSQTDAPLALVFTADGRILSANNQDNKVLILDGTQVFTAEAGKALTIGSLLVSINPGASELVLGTQTLTVPIKNQHTTAIATAVWTADASTFTAFKQGGTIVVHGSHLTTALEPGATATVAGEVLSAPVSGGLLVHGGNTATFKSADVTIDGVAITTLRPDGQRLVASAAANGDSIVVHQGSGSSFTLAAGEQTVVNGETVSAAHSGGVLVLVNASETVSLSLLPASATMGSSESGSPGSSGRGKTASPSTRSDSTGKTADGGASSSTSTPEAEDLSGGTGRGSVDSVSGLLSLLVFVMACVGLL